LRRLGTNLYITFLLMTSHYCFYLQTSSLIHNIFLTYFSSTSCVRETYNLFTLKNQVKFLEPLEIYLCCSPLVLYMKYNLLQSLCPFPIGLSKGIIFISNFILHTRNDTLMKNNTLKFLRKTPKSLFHC